MSFAQSERLGKYSALLRFLFAVASVALALPASAQQPPQLEAGARVRVTATTFAGFRVARFQALTDSTLVLADNGNPFVIPLSAVTQLEWNRSRSPNLLTGAVGLLLGGAAGAAAGCAANRDSYGVFCGGQSDTKVAVGAALGGIAGAAIGSLLFRRDQWVPVALPRRGGDTVQDIAGPDSARIAWLKKNGQTIDRAQVTVWAPLAMPNAWFRAFADTLELGITVARQMLSPITPWSRLGDRRITYYISPDSFISHATGDGAVLISWRRVENSTAPVKHEALHELLQPPAPYWSEEYTDTIVAREVERTWPMWLTEGLPDYLAARIEREHGLREGDVFGNGGLLRVDQSCREREKTDNRAIVEQYIPGRGYPAELFTNRRREVAPLFYGCSSSFVKYLVERYGLPAVVGLLPQKDPLAALEKIAGTTASNLRASWRRERDRQ